MSILKTAENATNKKIFKKTPLDLPKKKCKLINHVIWGSVIGIKISISRK